MRFTCPVDGALNEIPDLVTSFAFPADLTETMDLLEGRLNTFACQACGTSTALLTLVAVIDKDGMTALLMEPEGAAWEPEALAELTEARYRVERVQDYDALRVKIIEKLDHYLIPAAEVIFPGKENRLTRAEAIERISPLVLRVFKSRIDGYLPPLLRFSGDASPETLAKLEKDLYTAMVSDHLQRILKEAARESRVAALLEEVEKRVPKECLTAEVLAAVRANCRTYVAPDEDPHGFSGAFMQEVLNAVAYACAGKCNPRGAEMAVVLISAWIFSRRADTFVDPQFLLSLAMVQRIVRFENLWDVWMAGEHSLTKERLDEVKEILEHYGFSDRLLETLRGKVFGIGQQKDGRPIDPAKYEAVLEELLLEQITFNRSHDESSGFGDLVAGSLRHLLQNGQQEVALRLAQRMAEKAEEAGDEIAAVSLSAHAADELNNFHLFDAALEMITGALEGPRHHETWGPDLFVFFYTIVGNTMRYKFHYPEALSAYDLASKVLDTLPDESRRETDTEILEKNRGIIYRDTGRYTDALRLLKKAADRHPQDHNHQFGLAIFYLQINRYADARRCLNRAIELAHGGINAPVRGNYLLGRGILQKSQGEPDAGLEDLKSAIEILPTSAMKLRAAAAAIGFEPLNPEGKEFVAQCRNVVTEYLGQNENREIGLDALVYNELAGSMLRTGRAEDAQTLLERFWQEHEGRSRSPWQMHLLQGRVDYALGNNASAWKHLQQVWQILEARVPEAGEVDFAPSWMQDKDEVQSTLMNIGCELVQRGEISARILPALYDFSNGREISARLEKTKSSRWPPEELAAQYSAAARASKRNLDTFFFLESGRTILVGHAPARNPEIAIIGDLEIEPGSLRNIRERFRAVLRVANPADVGDLEARVEGWPALAARISSLILDHAAPDAGVVFLPGRAAAGLPLHLIQASAGKRLIEERTVCYSPNFTTLLAEPKEGTASNHEGFALVCVTAQKDGKRFRQAALDAAARLSEQFKGQSVVKYLEQEAADHSAIAGEMKRAKEIVFLCHGTTAGLEGGYGICLADGGDLPPRVLSVEEFPDHAKFILSWQDIVESPEVVASIACSSGLTKIGGGGVRFGLEQALFSGGTHTIISPLWDVEQRSALAWMERFYTHRFAHQDWTIPEAYRRTCLDMQDRYRNFYFWSPFAMNVSGIFQKEAP
jgi:tetratricopeptide (TPR) repeat protein